MVLHHPSRRMPRVLGQIMVVATASLGAIAGPIACASGDPIPSPSGSTGTVSSSQMSSTLAPGSSAPGTASQDQSGTGTALLPIEKACESFCLKVQACNPGSEGDLENCVFNCLQDSEQDSLAAGDPAQCLNSYVEYWQCQAAASCEDLGLGACPEIEDQLDLHCAPG